MKTQLLATFTTKTDLDKTIKNIKGAYTIAFNKIYVLQNENNVNELICTYNVEYDEDFIVNGTTVNKTGSGSSYTKIKVDISGVSNSTTFQLKVLNKVDVAVSINSISLEYRTLYKRVT